MFLEGQIHTLEGSPVSNQTKLKFSMVTERWLGYMFKLKLMQNCYAAIQCTN